MQRELGPVFPVAELLTSNPEVSKDDVMKALEELKEEGIISMLDEDSVQVNV